MIEIWIAVCRFELFCCLDLVWNVCSWFVGAGSRVSIASFNMSMYRGINIENDFYMYVPYCTACTRTYIILIVDYLLCCPCWV
jgi:hypothetical protein